MHLAINGTPAAKGIKVGDKVRLPNGTFHTVTASNINLLHKVANRDMPLPPPPPPRPMQKGLRFKRRG